MVPNDDCLVLFPLPCHARARASPTRQDRLRHRKDRALLFQGFDLLRLRGRDRQPLLEISSTAEPCVGNGRRGRLPPSCGAGSGVAEASCDLDGQPLVGRSPGSEARGDVRVSEYVLALACRVTDPYGTVGATLDRLAPFPAGVAFLEASVTGVTRRFADASRLEVVSGLVDHLTDVVCMTIRTRVESVKAGLKVAA